jgi:hypothetical protein
MKDLTVFNTEVVYINKAATNYGVVKVAGKLPRKEEVKGMLK